MASYSQVLIGGVDVTAYVFHWDIPETMGKEIDQLNMLLSKTVLDVLTFQNEQEVIAKRGPVNDTAQMHFYFRGFLTTWSPKGATFEVIAKNKLQQANKREVTRNYDINDDPQAGVLSAIAYDMLVNYAGYSSASVVDSSPYVVPVDKFPNNHVKVLDRVEVIRTVLNWNLRYDYENDLPVLEPKGHTANANVLRYDGTSSQNITEIPKWDNDSEQILNSVTIIGRPVQDILTESFDGDGSKTVFQLSKTPYQTEVFVDGIKKVAGVPGQAGAYDYLVDQFKMQIIFTAAPAPGSGNVEVNFGIFKPPAATKENADSIDTYGLSEDTLQFYDVVTVQDAETRASDILNRFSVPLKSTQLRIQHTDTPIRAGETIHVVDTANNVDDWFIVTDILHQWPEPEDYISVGNETTFEQNTVLSINDRLTALERTDFQNIDDITISKDLNATMRASTHLVVDWRDTSVDGAWGKGFGDGASRGDLKWGEAGALWQNAHTNAEQVWAVTWPDNTYEEEFTTSYFVDASTTTATVDTVLNEVRF